MAMNEGLQEAKRLYESGKIDPALSVLLSAKAGEGEETEFAYYLGLCYARLERFEEALLYLERVVTASPDDFRVRQCRFALAYVYAVTKRSRMAEYELKELLGKGSEDARLFSALGFTAYEQGKIDEALGFYDRALEIDPENASALNSAGYILANEGIDSKKALVYCRKALESNPNNPAYLDSVGWAFYRSGMAERARVYLERAVQQSPANETILDHYKEVTEVAQ
jgi:Flp pilus assembly protein TadD